MMSLKQLSARTRVHYRCFHRCLTGVTQVDEAFVPVLFEVDSFMAEIARAFRRRGYTVHFNDQDDMTSCLVEVGGCGDEWDALLKVWDEIVGELNDAWTATVKSVEEYLSERFPGRAWVEDASDDEWSLQAFITLPRKNCLELYALTVRIEEDGVDDVFFCDAAYWVSIVVVERAPGLSDEDLTRAALLFTYSLNTYEKTEEVAFTSEGEPIPLSELHNR